MPFKKDFFTMMKMYSRLPYSQPIQMVKEFAKLQVENLQLIADAKEKEEEIQKLKAQAEDLELKIALMMQNELNQTPNGETPGEPQQQKGKN